MVVCIRDLVWMFLSSLRMLRKIAMRTMSAHAQSRQADIAEKKKSPAIEVDNTKDSRNKKAIQVNEEIGLTSLHLFKI